MVHVGSVMGGWGDQGERVVGADGKARQGHPKRQGCWGAPIRLNPPPAILTRSPGGTVVHPDATRPQFIRKSCSVELIMHQRGCSSHWPPSTQCTLSTPKRIQNGFLPKSRETAGTWQRGQNLEISQAASDIGAPLPMCLDHAAHRVLAQERGSGSTVRANQSPLTNAKRSQD